MSTMLRILAAAIVCGAPVTLRAEVVAPGELVVLTAGPAAPNGAWSWFEDERAVIDGTRLLVSSVSDRIGGESESGDIDLHWYDVATRERGSVELADRLDNNDHSSAALWIRPDGRYVAAYSEHNIGTIMRFRISTAPHDPTSWGDESTFDVTVAGGSGAVGYSNLYHLPSDRGGAGRLYHFSRHDNADPNVLVSEDDGESWVYGGKLVTEGDGGTIPYAKYAADGQRIHVTLTDDHPAFSSSGIFHGAIRDGALADSHGAIVDASVLDAEAVAVDRLTPVFVSGTTIDGTPMTRPWTVDLAVDGSGRPYAVFSVREADDPDRHHFLWSRFDGGEWHVRPLCAAGAYLPPNEDYTGLAALVPGDPSRVIVSTTIDPRDGTSTPRYELYEGHSPDDGESWSWTAVTERSVVDNLRPIVPAWNGASVALVWMRGTYGSWTSWETEVVALVRLGERPAPARRPRALGRPAREASFPRQSTE